VASPVWAAQGLSAYRVAVRGPVEHLRTAEQSDETNPPTGRTLKSHWIPAWRGQSGGPRTAMGRQEGQSYRAGLWAFESPNLRGKVRGTAPSASARRPGRLREADPKPTPRPRAAIPTRRDSTGNAIGIQSDLCVGGALLPMNDGTANQHNFSEAPAIRPSRGSRHAWRVPPAPDGGAVPAGLTRSEEVTRPGTATVECPSPHPHERGAFVRAGLG
jgi:hypothetical protein